MMRIPFTSIVVDYWSIQNTRPGCVHFLTHMHADHTRGLTGRWPYQIYCSEVTRDLALANLGLRGSKVIGLSLNEPHLIDIGKSRTITVTLIDANHAPGAVMFLFQGYFGNILHTGDFRYTSEMFARPPLSTPLPIERMYFDNTYSELGIDLPNRIDAMKRICNAIEGHPQKSIVIGVRNLGKETILEDVAQIFNTWIVVNQTYLDHLKLLRMKDVFTTDQSAGWISAESMVTLTPRRVKLLMSLGALVIIPSAHPTYAQKYRNFPNVKVIPYSDHSSPKELTLFIARVSPKRLFPIVRNQKVNLGQYNHLLDDTAPLKVKLPSGLFLQNLRPVKSSIVKPRSIAPKRTPQGVVFDEQIAQAAAAQGHLLDVSNSKRKSLVPSKSSDNSQSNSTQRSSSMMNTQVIRADTSLAAPVASTSGYVYLRTTPHQLPYVWVQPCTVTISRQSNPSISISQSVNSLSALCHPPSVSNSGTQILVNSATSTAVPAPKSSNPSLTQTSSIRTWTDVLKSVPVLNGGISTVVLKPSLVFESRSSAVSTSSTQLQPNTQIDCVGEGRVDPDTEENDPRLIVIQPSEITDSADDSDVEIVQAKVVLKGIKKEQEPVKLIPAANASHCLQNEDGSQSKRYSPADVQVNSSAGSRECDLLSDMMIDWDCSLMSPVAGNVRRSDAINCQPECRNPQSLHNQVAQSEDGHSHRVSLKSQSKNSIGQRDNEDSTPSGQDVSLIPTVCKMPRESAGNKEVSCHTPLPVNSKTLDIAQPNDLGNLQNVSQCLSKDLDASQSSYVQGVAQNVLAEESLGSCETLQSNYSSTKSATKKIVGVVMPWIKEKITPELGPEVPSYSESSLEKESSSETCGKEVHANVDLKSAIDTQLSKIEVVIDVDVKPEDELNCTEDLGDRNIGSAKVISCQVVSEASRTAEKVVYDLFLNRVEESSLHNTSTELRTATSKREKHKKHKKKRVKGKSLKKQMPKETKLRRSTRCVAGPKNKDAPQSDLGVVEPCEVVIKDCMNNLKSKQRDAIPLNSDSVKDIARDRCIKDGNKETSTAVANCSVSVKTSEDNMDPICSNLDEASKSRGVAKAVGVPKRKADRLNSDRLEVKKLLFKEKKKRKRSEKKKQKRRKVSALERSEVPERVATPASSLSCRKNFSPSASGLLVTVVPAKKAGAENNVLDDDLCEEKQRDSKLDTIKSTVQNVLQKIEDKLPCRTVLESCASDVSSVVVSRKDGHKKTKKKKNEVHASDSTKSKEEKKKRKKDFGEIEGADTPEQNVLLADEDIMTPSQCSKLPDIKMSKLNLNPSKMFKGDLQELSQCKLVPSRGLKRKHDSQDGRHTDFDVQEIKDCSSLVPSRCYVTNLPTELETKHLLMKSPKLLDTSRVSPQITKVEFCPLKFRQSVLDELGIEKKVDLDSKENVKIRAKKIKRMKIPKYYLEDAWNELYGTNKDVKYFKKAGP